LTVFQNALEEDNK